VIVRWIRTARDVVALCTGILVLILYLLSVRPALDSLENRIDNTKTLEDFSELPPQTSMEKARDRDKEAQALLEGAGRQEWKIGGRTWRIGGVVYANGWKWVEEVFPKTQRRQDSSSCAIEAGGRLTIRGLSVTRHAALIEYQSPGPSEGTPCDLVCSSSILFPKKDRNSYATLQNKPIPR
jgi:hypothetical protein